MDLDLLTLGQIKEIKNLIGGQCEIDHPYEIGRNYFIRTVTMIQIGRLVRVTGKELLLEEAVWCADTGRFTAAMLEGKLNEVELFPANEKVIVGRGAVIDACPWNFELPKEQK